MKKKNLTWWIIGFLGFASFVMGVWGLRALYYQNNIDYHGSDLFFTAMKLFAMESNDDFKLPVLLDIARWMAPLTLIAAATITILHFIRREFRDFFLFRKKGHIIIASLNERSRYLIKDLLKQGEKVVIISDVEDPHRYDPLEKQGAAIVEGDINSKTFLKQIAAHKAKAFVFLDENDDDNISKAMSISHFLVDKSKVDNQTLYTHVADGIKLNELNELQFLKQIKDVGKGNYNFRFIASNERASRMIFNKYSPDVFKPVNADSEQVHVAIIGLGKLAQSMVIRLARIGHYANLKKVKVTIFHDNEKRSARLYQGIRSLKQLIDIEDVFCEDLVLFNEENFENIHHQHAFSVAYLMCENDETAISVLNRLSRIKSKDQLDTVLTLNNPEGVLSKWYNVKELNKLNIHKFNVIEESFTHEALLSEELDMIALKINAGYHGIEDAKKAQQLWYNLDSVGQDANREPADHIYVKLRALNRDVDRAIEQIPTLEESQPEVMELLAEMEHKRWYAHKVLSGYQYGPVSSVEDKTNEYLIPYADLDEATKKYDRDIITAIPKLMKN